MTAMPSTTLPEVTVTATPLRPSTGLVLRIKGKDYGGWLSMRVRLDLQTAAREFACEVSERWPKQTQTWQIKPGDPVQVLLDGDLVVTGYVDVYSPSFDGRSHRVEVRGRSKTADLVDGSAIVDGGQFKGLTVDEIARKVADPFGIKVTTDGTKTDKVADVQVQQGETAHGVIERMSRVSEVLVSDDASGNLRLARIGGRRAAGPLVQGKNILAGHADLDDSGRYSVVVVKSHHANTEDKADWDGETGNGGANTRRRGRGAGGASRAGEADDSGDDDSGGEQPAVGDDGDTVVSPSGKAVDKAVTRYRPLLIYGETQMTAEQAAARAAWEVRRRTGQAVKATIVVQGWRQVDGTLWDTDLTVAVTAPWLGLDNVSLVVASVEFQADEGGTRTELGLTLGDAFLPTEQQARAADKTASGKDTETKADFWKGATDTVPGT